MNSSVRTPLRLAIALLLVELLVSGCSGSSGSRSPSGPDASDADGAGDVYPVDGVTNGDLDDTTSPSQDLPEMPVDDPSATDPALAAPTVDGPAIPDPTAQGSTEVRLEITVPAYVSDTLEVRVSRGGEAIVAEWIGDELWSASIRLPTDTEHLLSITFVETNGDMTLASLERRFTTGTDDLEILAIGADDFVTDRWDADGDGVSNIDEPRAGADDPDSPRVLLFSETRAFRHDSIPDALDALEELATSAGIRTDRAADSAGVFTDATLAGYDAVAWVLTSGDVLDDGEQNAFERYIRAGGGYAGMHAASDTEYDWPWYGELVGAWFARHPRVQSARQEVEDGSHPSTVELGATWTRTDEWYDYRTNPRARVNVLLSLDESSYSGGGMGDDHPSAWYHVHDGGRSWYTGGGHTRESYAEPAFRAHLLGGLRHAAGVDSAR